MSVGPSISSLLSGQDRQALAYSVVSVILTGAGLWAWDLEYESPLFLLPMLGCTVALAALYHAFEQHKGISHPSMPARYALALGTLALLSANLPLLFAPAFGWIAGIPFAALLLLRVESSWPSGSLVLGLVGALSYPVLFTISNDAGFLAFFIGPVLALVGLLLGVNELRRLAEPPAELLFGLALDVLLLFCPAMFVVAHIAGED